MALIHESPLQQSMFSQDIHHFCWRYHYRLVREMLLVASHQIGIIFRQGHFIENNVIGVREMLNRTYFFTTNTIHQYPVYCPLYKVLWDIKLLALQHFYVFVYNFITIDGDDFPLQNSTKTFEVAACRFFVI